MQTYVLAIMCAWNNMWSRCPSREITSLLLAGRCSTQLTRYESALSMVPTSRTSTLVTASTRPRFRTASMRRVKDENSMSSSANAASSNSSNVLGEGMYYRTVVRIGS